jgi:hypothetical protein
MIAPAMKLRSMRSNELPFERRTFAPNFRWRLFRPALCAALSPWHRLNAGSAAADAAADAAARAALKALLLAFIAFFSSGGRFDVFSRRRTGCSASLLRKGNATHEERHDRAKRHRSANNHEVFLTLLMRHIPNVEAGQWLRLWGGAAFPDERDVTGARTPPTYCY